MGKLLCYIVLITTALATNISYALDVPHRSKYDGRVRYVTYNPDDVVLLHTVLGIATAIILEEDERYVDHAFGDSEAWNVTNSRNIVFLKPKNQFSGTNFHLVTNKRFYSFKIKYHHDLNGRGYYKVKFKYPDSELKKRSKIATKMAIEREFKLGDGIYNLSYSMSGDTSIAPTNVWDDGVFTYFKFPGNRDLPNIYLVHEDNSESLVNKHPYGKSKNVVVMHKVSPEWVLRTNSEALAIFNESYDPIGRQTDTGTKSSRVKRVLKKQGE